MSQLSDQDYLRNEQYRDASRLNARINLHAQFSVNPYDWFLWVFDQYDCPPQARILELGCGQGDLWRKNRERIPLGWEVVLSDFSEGMLAQAQENLAESRIPIIFKLIDAQSIPYPQATFDAVIANHMLYHTPDRAKALVEIRRVLKPGGDLYATTIGRNHLRELPELVLGFDPDLPLQSFDGIGDFSLESGAAQLMSLFSQVTMRRYEDALHITQAEPLVDYVLSGFRWGIDGQRRAEFLAYIQGLLEAYGGLIRISKDSGMFIAS
jgi:ubiquinone/menaquinone biosynthesis C-methylase UbiE